MNDDLYDAMAEKAKEHARSKGLSDEWAMGFLNAVWYTAEAGVEAAASRPEKAGLVRSTGLEWVYECGICDHRGNAHYSDGAFANLGNHVMREHITVKKDARV